MCNSSRGRGGGTTVAALQSGHVTLLPIWSGVTCMSVPHSPQCTGTYSGRGIGGDAGS
ncbi:MAG: hypothetical protein ABSG86_29760 [Thermoguttaceae bacterium]